MRYLSILILFSSVLLLGVGPCSPSLTDVCEQHFPRYEQQLATAADVLKNANPTTGPDGRVEPGRVIASTADRASWVYTEDRREWQSWAERLLKDTQHFMDALDQDPNLYDIRAKLSDAANELVAFHGYTQMAQFERMRTSVGRVIERGREARELVCSHVQQETGRLAQSTAGTGE